MATLQAQPRAPHYTIFFPAQISSGEYVGDYDIFSAGFTADGLLDGTPTQLKPVSSQSYKELSPLAIPDMNGGYYLAYTIEHNDSAHRGDRDILMRHIDGFGSDRWGDSANHAVVVAQSKFIEENPKVVILTDGSLLIFYEVRYGPTPHADVDVAVVRISSGGQMLWSTGKWGAKSNKQERLVDAISDDRGGAIALLEARTYRDSVLAGADVLAQHVDSGGVIGWKDATEPAIVAASPYLDRNPVMVSDGFGGAYIAYQIEYTKGPRAGDVDIIAQHLTSYGSRAWTDENKPPIVSSNAKALEERPVIMRDSAGIIVAFEVSFQPAKLKTLVHVIGMQRMDSAGQPVWNGGKKSKLIGLRDDIAERPQLVSDPMGGCYLIFEGRDTATGNRDIYVQRISIEGDQIWGDGERPVAVFNSPDSESHATAASDGIGGLVLVAKKEMLSDSLAGYDALVAQRVAIDGSLPWADMSAPITVVASAFKAGAPVLLKQ